METIKKEIILWLTIGVLCYVIYSIYKHETKPEIIPLDNIQQGIDSVIIIEKHHENQTKIINRFYEVKKDSIIHLPDSVQFDLLKSNIDRFSYLLNTATSQNN